MICELGSSGTIELFFYGELAADERAEVRRHLQRCPECRAVLEDLTLIRAALASRPDVATPAGGDWSRFMSRLSEAIAVSPGRTPPHGSEPRLLVLPPRRSFVPYLAMAALLALVTVSVLLLFRTEAGKPPDGTLGTRPEPARTLVGPQGSSDPALVSVSGQHFERSKLVVLGLATRDAAGAEAANWRYERELASSLLSDTRLYRLAAEERGMKTLAGVMRDLELVLLQISMAEEEDSESLEQLQRLIRRRDLITKMNVAHAVEP